MTKIVPIIVLIFLFLSKASTAEDCSKFEKLSKEFAKCNSDLIKQKTSKKIKEGKKKLSALKIKETFIKFKNSKTHKEFMDKIKNEN